MRRMIAAARGRGIWLRETIRALSGNNGSIREWIAMRTGIAERKRIVQTHDRLIALLDATPDVVKIADPDGRMLYINRAGRRILGIGLEEDISKRSIIDGHPSWAYELIRREGVPRALQEGLWRGETTLADALGREIPVSQVIIAHKTKDGRIDFIASVARDISERKRLEERLRHQATHDPLTGLANRAFLCESLEQALRSAERQKRLVAVLFVDVDGFKHINDTLGHAAGDELLCAAAKRLAGCLRESDVIARHGGDEFVVVLPDIRHLADVSPVLQKIEGVFADPFVFGDQNLLLTCSIGMAIYPRDGRDSNTLLKRADSTMYRVKELTRSGELSAPCPRARGPQQELLSLAGEVRRVVDDCTRMPIAYEPLTNEQQPLASELVMDVANDGGRVRAERRCSARKAVDIEVLVRYGSFDFECGRVRNVSTGGVFIDMDVSTMDIRAAPPYVPVDLVFFQRKGEVNPLSPILAMVAHVTPRGLGLKLTSRLNRASGLFAAFELRRETKASTR
jgi:diguanylate cyclase (GGDEF)-like protein/PAS domain S-box-containing protein